MRQAFLLNQNGNTARKIFSWLHYRSLSLSLSVAEMTRTKLSSCCISHEFLKAATRNPNKVAVIHGCGGANIAREFRSNNNATSVSDINYDNFFGDLFAAAAPSSNPPVCSGDRCFTFSEILSAVDSLSSRLRRILDGGDDPYLVRPTSGNFLSEQPVQSECSNSCSLGVKQSTEDQYMYTPKILGIYMVPSVEYIIAVLSVLRCGEAFMPLDPLWPKERISTIVALSNVDLIIRCQSSFDGSGCHEPDKSEGLVDCSTCPELFISMKENLQQQFGSSNLAWHCENEKTRSFCYLMFTSGSTGKPKGVCGTETGLVNRVLWMQELYPSVGEELLLFKTSISFIDHLQECLGALLATCTLVIPPFNEFKENPFYVYDFLQFCRSTENFGCFGNIVEQAYSINRLIAVPSLMRVILPALQSPYNMRVQSSLKMLVLSGEVFPMSLWEMLYKLLPKTTILNLYGSTEAFCDALMVEMVSDDDDFFIMGGNSISVAHVSYNLGIDMGLLYVFPSPLKLQMALLEKESLCNTNERTAVNEAQEERMLISLDSKMPNLQSSKPCGRFSRTLSNKSDDYPSKFQKVHLNFCGNSKGNSFVDGYPWNSNSIRVPCSCSRCNRVIYDGAYEGNNLWQATLSVEIPRNKRGAMQELWKVHMESCVDASPLLVFKEQDFFLFIGSHSYKFLCINAKSGFVQWEIKLGGRIECSAAILGNFSQVVVGCYQGKIYFLDFSNGNICWSFQTCGEVKSQPVVDKCRHLVWCGSHDHNLYALDYKNYCCVYKIPCGGSIYGSPVIDEVHNTLYVASTGGRVTAISIESMTFSKRWLHELEAPVFGSLSINSYNGNVICCLVDGHVVALDSHGSIIWKVKTGGPIFAGPCISYTLPSQVLICSRDGNIYSFELEKGDLLWEYNVGVPITSSAYVDENLQLVSTSSLISDRLICVCASSGSIYLLRIPSDCAGELNSVRKDVVQEFARLDLQGDIFSSPVMIGGRIFVGCRDDYVHCLGLET
ncbi:putative acyl-activating enzyme 19 isoform X8 [Camellia sinensis]|uniref:putative acyl-activating enzyme 19 isoform X8 n=1 Tax=Camellia sinensis TaxID=4442 RepID=UPI00103589CA|nr:putative acyl-activating enzyme 19 isoform X8 [Camellia sinensis]